MHNGFAEGCVAATRPSANEKSSNSNGISRQDKRVALGSKKHTTSVVLSLSVFRQQ